MKFFLLISFLIQSVIILAQTANQVSMFHGNVNHDGVYPEKEFTDFADVKWKFKTQGKIFSSPAILNGVAYIGSEDKHLYAVDVVTGKMLWKFKTKGAVHSSPAVFKETIYFGSFDGNVYAVDIHTGKEKWRVRTEGEKRVGEKGYWGMKPENHFMEDPWDLFLSSPIIDYEAKKPLLYFGSSDGNIVAVDALDGSLKWKFKTNGIVHSSPTLHKGIIYSGSWDTFIYAIDAKSGKEIWKFKTGDQPMMSGIQASVAAKDDRIYIGCRDANFYCLTAETGELLWKYSADNAWILSTAAIRDSTVYVGTSDSYLMLAIDAKTGKENYRFKENGYAFSSPALVGNTAFFGDFTGKMYALDLTSKGTRFNFFETEGRKNLAASVLKDNNLDFQFSAKGADLQLYRSTIDVMNQFYTLGSIVSSPVIQHGVIYFGSADGYLYAVNLKND